MHLNVAQSIVRYKTVVILVTLGLLQVMAEVAVGGFESFPDTDSYVQTVLWFKDGSGEELPLRIQRPLQIIAVLAFEPLLGVEGALILTNSAFYILSIPFFWLFSRRLLRDEQLATLCAALFMSSFCVLYWGLGLGTDMLVWLSFSIGAYILVRVRDNWRPKDVYALALVAGIAILNKESAAVLGLLLVLVYIQVHLKSRPGLLRKLTDTIPPLAVMAMPFLVVQLWVLSYFGPGSTFFDFHMTHKTDDIRGDVLYLPLTLLIAFNVLWLPYVLGFKSHFLRRLSVKRIEYLAWMTVTLTPVAVFEQYSPRLSFLPFYLVLPVAAIGVNWVAERAGQKERRWMLLAFVISYAVVNNLAAVFGDELRSLLGIWSR